ASAGFGWSQQIAVPCSPYQTFAVEGFASREFDFESVRVRCGFYDGATQFLTDRSGPSPVGSTAGDGEFLSPVEVPGGAGSAIVYPGGRISQSWIRFDDLQLFTEQFANETTTNGEHWSSSGGASITSDIATLPDGGAISQRVVTGLAGQQYFVSTRFAASALT